MACPLQDKPEETPPKIHFGSNPREPVDPIAEQPEQPVSIPVNIQRDIIDEFVIRSNEPDQRPIIVSDPQVRQHQNVPQNVQRAIENAMQPRQQIPQIQAPNQVVNAHAQRTQAIAYIALLIIAAIMIAILVIALMNHATPAAANVTDNVTAINSTMSAIISQNATATFDISNITTQPTPVIVNTTVVTTATTTEPVPEGPMMNGVAMNPVYDENGTITGWSAQSSSRLDIATQG